MRDDAAPPGPGLDGGSTRIVQTLPPAVGAGAPTGNVADTVRAAAARTPDKLAFVAGADEVTWGAFDGLVDDAAGRLRGLGLGDGDRLGLLLGNTIDFAVLYFGALRAGLVALPMNTAYTLAETRFLLADSGARAVVAEPARAAELLPLRAELADLETVAVARRTDAAPADAVVLADVTPAVPPQGPVRAGEDLAVLLYTSGTSGRPKGAMLSHRALLADLAHVEAIAPPVATADDVALLVLPLFHVYGLNSGLGMVANKGATGVLVDRFDPVTTLAEIRAHRVSVIVGAPPMYVAWSMLPEVGEAFSSVRLAISGSAPLSGAVLARIREATGRHVFEGYGLTETAPTVTSTLMSDEPRPGSIGRPVPGVQVTLLDEDGAAVEPGDPGEVTVRGANLFSGYWPDGAGGPDAEGWFRTGDVAYADPGGDLYLVDRRRDLILVSGFNVYPREVETVVLSHPDVAEVAVIGIPHPYTGESVKALVVPEPGRTPTADDVIRYCARVLARFKCPTAVEFVDDLPHTATGKISKGRLRETLAAS